jgi:hypothetical protein
MVKWALIFESSNEQQLMNQAIVGLGVIFIGMVLAMAGLRYRRY